MTENTYTYRTAVALTTGLLMVFSVYGSVLGQEGRREAPIKKRLPRRSTPAFSPQNPRLELVRIPAGTFMMGSSNGPSNERPVHKVTINYSFYIGKYEVTQAQWQKVMGNNPSHFHRCGGNCPVEGVSRNDAQNFIDKLNRLDHAFKYRLPTESEWEYACRAGTAGDNAGALSDTAWFSENSGGSTHPVGQKQSNAWGLADMLGNVLEWCADSYHHTYDGAPTDGSAWLDSQQTRSEVFRGGSWCGRAPSMRATSRNDSGCGEGWLISRGLRVVAVR